MKQFEKMKIPLILSLLLLKTISTEDLQSQDESQIDPLTQLQVEYTRDHDKRTLFNGHTYTLGKHIGIHPSGFKYVLGYGPIDVRYVPVVKPVTIFKPVLHAPWKPMLKTKWKVKPIVPVVPFKPVVSVPVKHEGWNPVVAMFKPVHLHNPWHQHIHVEQQLIPGQQLVPIKPAVPFQPVSLFHVTKPNLGVLPFGTTFPAVVHQPVHHVKPVVPAVPVQPVQSQIPVHQIHPTQPQFPVHQVPAPAPQPIPVPHPVHHPAPIPYPVHHPESVPAPHPAPNPAPLGPTIVEYHGSHHLVPFNNQFSFSHFNPAVFRPSAVIPQFGHQFPQGFLPGSSQVPTEQHHPQVPIHPQQVPHYPEHQPQVPNYSEHQPQVPIYSEHQPQVPIHSQHQPQVPVHSQHPQQIPVYTQQQPQFPNQHGQQVPLNPEYKPHEHHGQLPVDTGREPHNFNFEPGVQQPLPFDQFDQFDQVDQYDSRVPTGQSDLQFPAYLPSHPNFRDGNFANQGNFDQFSDFQQNSISRPSISLEPPYTYSQQR